MTALAYALYGFGVTGLGVGLVPFMGVLLVLGWSLGLAGISAVLGFGENAQDRMAWAAGPDVVCAAATPALFGWAPRYARKHGNAVPVRRLGSES